MSDSLPDDSNNSNVCSTHDTIDDETLDPPNTMVGSSKNRKGKDKLHISDALKHCVDLKDKRMENLVLKAIADSEARMTNLFTEAIRAVGNSNVFKFLEK